MAPRKIPRGSIISKPYVLATCLSHGAPNLLGSDPGITVCESRHAERNLLLFDLSKSNLKSPRSAPLIIRHSFGRMRKCNIHKRKFDWFDWFEELGERSNYSSFTSDHVNLIVLPHFQSRHTASRDGKKKKEKDALESSTRFESRDP